MTPMKTTCVLCVPRELEREVNVGWTDIVPESEADGSLLALMLYRSGFILIMDQISTKTQNPKCRLFLKIDQ